MDQVFTDINAILDAQQRPLLVLEEHRWGKGTHCYVLAKGSSRMLCPSRNYRECRRWLEGFLAALQYKGPAVSEAAKADAYY